MFHQINMRTALGLAAAGAGLCFVGYCIYFDRKRRSDPLYKQRIRERRKVKKTSKSGSTEFPDPKDSQAMQQFFLQEIQLGEDLLGKGEVEQGVEHISNAVAVCGQPQNLLQVLQQTLPPQVFMMLMQRLPATTEKLSRKVAAQAKPDGAEPAMVSEDVE